ncbi:MAG: hypothetical protein K2J68_01575 [Treponemataceae bacterium]|nr:hypothetical protein [Treponemataceae bacterium]
MFKKLRAYIIILLISAGMAFAQGSAEKKYPLRYYGIVSNLNDQNILNMAQDLFIAQIRGINYISLEDKRNSEIKKSYSSISSDKDGSEFFSLVENSEQIQGETILFYARIFRPNPDEKWECTFFAKNTQSKIIYSQTRSYDSHYKVLLDAKMLIQNVVAEASGNTNNVEMPVVPNKPLEHPKNLNVENIAGTWSGEDEISKIVLLRSGRGFVIFSNGATMNISILLSDENSSQKFRVVQQDKFNASFYPDIERKTVLAFAEDATPIEWNLTMTSPGTLEGTKKTLVASAGGVEQKNVNVVWKKK